MCFLDFFGMQRLTPGYRLFKPAEECERLANDGHQIGHQRDDTTRLRAVPPDTATLILKIKQHRPGQNKTRPDAPPRFT